MYSTVSLVPWVTGLPTITFGLMVIRSSRFFHQLAWNDSLHIDHYNSFISYSTMTIILEKIEIGNSLLILTLVSF